MGYWAKYRRRRRSRFAMYYQSDEPNTKLENMENMVVIPTGYKVEHIMKQKLDENVQSQQDDEVNRLLQSVSNQEDEIRNLSESLMRQKIHIDQEKIDTLQKIVKEGQQISLLHLELDTVKQVVEPINNEDIAANSILNEIIEINRSKYNTMETSEKKSFGIIVELNVGGNVYKTLKKTLLRHESIIKTMLEQYEDGGFDVETDPEGRILFCDVPFANYFPYILDFLRTGLPSQKDTNEVVETAEEIERRKEIEIEREAGLVKADIINDDMSEDSETTTEKSDQSDCDDFFEFPDMNLVQLGEFLDLCNYFGVSALKEKIEEKITVLSLGDSMYELTLETMKDKFSTEGLEKQLKDLDLKKAELLERIEKLSEEQRQTVAVWEKESAKIRQVKKSLDEQRLEFLEKNSVTDIVKYNVGGELFTFKIDKILIQTDSLLSELIKGIGKEGLCNEIFIDRNPVPFRLIAEFINQGFISPEKMPSTLKQRQKVMDEGSFYKLPNFVKYMDPCRYPEEQLSTEDRQMRDQETVLRKMFATDRDNPLLDDPYISLISVFDFLETFKPEIVSENLPLLFNFENPPSNYDRSSFMDFQIIPTIARCKEEFETHWNIFTGGVLEGLDWSGVFAAGGGVLACVNSIHREHATDPLKGIHSFLYSRQYENSDVDLFIYGLNEQQAEDKIRHIYYTIKKNIENDNDPDVFITRTKLALTINVKRSRPIQIILRIYKGPAEVLIGFDIDSCCVGFDGRDVWASPRFRRAISKRYNLIDEERQSLTYERRLMKYAKRGFRVLAIGYNPLFVRKKGLLDDLENVKVGDVKGLARLLLFEKRFKHSQAYSSYRAQNLENKKISFIQTPANLFSHDSDYFGCYLAKLSEHEKVATLKKSFDDSVLQYKKYASTSISGFKKPPGVIGLLNDIETILDSSTVKHTSLYHRIKWITIEPGRQVIGSFHPISNNFYKYAYEKDAIYEPVNSRGEVIKRMPCPETETPPRNYKKQNDGFEEESENSEEEKEDNENKKSEKTNLEIEKQDPIDESSDDGETKQYPESDDIPLSIIDTNYSGSAEVLQYNISHVE